MITKYKFLYYASLALGLLGILDIATQDFVSARYPELSDIGVVGIGTLIAFGYLFGANLGSVVATLLLIPFRLSVVWLAIAYFLRKKLNNLERPSEANAKAEKTAMTRAAIAIGLLFFLPLVFTFLMLVLGSATHALWIVILGVLLFVYLLKRRKRTEKNKS